MKEITPESIIRFAKAPRRPDPIREAVVRAAQACWRIAADHERRGNTDEANVALECSAEVLKIGIVNENESLVSLEVKLLAIAVCCPKWRPAVCRLGFKTKALSPAVATLRGKNVSAEEDCIKAITDPRLRSRVLNNCDVLCVGGPGRGFSDKEMLDMVAEHWRLRQTAAPCTP